MLGVVVHIVHKYRQSVVVSMTHVWLGRIIVLTGIINIPFGIALYEKLNSTVLTVLNICYGVWIGLLSLAFFGLS